MKKSGINIHRNQKNPGVLTQMSVNHKKICSLPLLKFVSLTASFEAQRKKGFFNNRWKMNMKAQSILAIVLVLIMLVSVFAWLSAETQSRPSIIEVMSNGTIASPSPTNQQTSTPTGTGTPPTPSRSDQWNPISIITEIITPSAKPTGLIESNPNVNGSVWKSIAAKAWQYFQPGIGVDSSTGLPYAGGTTFPYLTVWDLGAYIQAVINAQKIGLIGTDGSWNSSVRLEKVLTFLETRELNTTTQYPFWFYDATTGKNYHPLSDIATGTVDGVDTGRLFVALNNLRSFNTSLVPRINNVVLTGRSNYAALVPSIKSESLTSTSIYLYYFGNGYASFWPDNLASFSSTILNNIFSAGNITSYGVSLPKAGILGDPLFCSIFELNNNDSRLIALARQVYLSHEAYSNATSAYVAFSEGNSYNGYYIYEWVVTPDGETWKVMVAGASGYSDINPVIYNKIAFSFLSLYNSTFARNMVVYLEQSLPDPSNGYSDGSDYNTDINSRNLVLMVGSNTNSMILGSATYAIQDNP
jgi:hypothetical protein